MGKACLNEIGYACSYVPIEIISAAGLSPLRLIPEGLCIEADSMMHPNTCCYVRSMLADLLRGRFSHIQGMVFVNSCDAMRKLYDIWADKADRPAAIFLDIPKKKDSGSVRFFAAELKRFAVTLEGQCNGLRVTVPALNKAIEEHNAIRSSARNVLSSLTRRDAGLSGSEVFPMLLEKTLHATREQATKLSRKSAGVPKDRDPDGMRRIVLSGTIMSKSSVVETIEARNCKIVAFDTCFGMKHYETPVPEGTFNPFTAIAERYLTRPACPRMEGIKQQVEYLTHLAKDTCADGVIISSVKYCDHILYSIPLIQKNLKAAGIPVLILENDYNWPDPAKASIRIEAFLETIS